MLAITVGNGLSRPTGIYTPVPEPAVDGLARILSELPAVEEGWWSGHLWKDNLRRANLWLATSVITLDVDYETDGEPFPEHREAIVELAATGKLPGSIFHLTPHGARVLFALDHPYSEKKDLLAASAAAVTLVSDAIAGSGYKVDEPVARDLARLYFTPNAKAKGVARKADVVVMRREQYTAAQLIADATPAPSPAPPPRKLSLIRNQSFEQAAEQWVSDHRREYDKKPGRCPVCDDSGSFHELPDHTDRWYCFSTDHVEIGIQGNNGWHGDALDLEAHARHCKPVDVLRSDGYLSALVPRATRAATTNAEPAPEAEPTPAPSGAFRPWRSRSYLTAVSIIEANSRDVLEGRRIELNEMTGRVEIGRRLVRDADVSRIRALIEARFVGGVDKNNNEIGLQLSVSDMFAAIEQCAAARSYHPVREYLDGLKWDGIERLNKVADDILNVPAESLALAMLLVRKFFISAVARALDPGCKVDTVLILVGLQGALKSTFFRTIANPWFDDTAIDLSKKDAFESLRNAWILEWAELESLLRARDTNSVKAFLSSSKDTYRPSYGRNVIEVKRSNVIVGSTNNDEFLNDETGARRFHPVRVGVIDIRVAAEQRDQLWAEAVHAYRAGEAWWLGQEEDGALAAVHDQHRVRDAWEDEILSYAEGNAFPFTTADVLTDALHKPMGQWDRADEMRVSKVLKSCGWERKTDARNSKTKKWRKRS